MSTPARHPASGQYVPPAAGLPSSEAVNAHLDDVPDVPGHDQAMSTGAMPMDLPPGPDAGSKNTGGDDAGFPS